MPQTYVARLADARLDRLLEAHPAVMLVGPRAAGKTTTARRHASTEVRLDRPAEAAAFRADPDAALARFEGCVLLDEWQAVPEVLGAVKRAVDDGAPPGRFLLTGSVRADIDAPSWPGTGRAIRLPMYGLTVREVEGRSTSPNPLDVLAEQDEPDWRSFEAFSLPDYIDLALRGGFPDPVIRLDAPDRPDWFDSYVRQLLTRDASALSPRDPHRLGRYFEALALNSAGVTADTTLLEAAAVDRRTAVAYERLLSDLYVLDVVPAWTTNRLSRLVKRPKRYLTDSSLVGAALRLDATAVLRDGGLMGRLLDTFVAAQLRAEASVSSTRARLYHLREKEGRREVDLLAELGADRVIAVEVKATSAPSLRDARHLAWLRDRLGERFVRGVVLHTGPDGFALADRLLALPICALWNTPT